jgi:ATP-dependent RNA helicase SUPV3L1/SUV3
VYQLAERLRERRGGVAVVLGALSPRTRNAQVALYQSGEVQYMVATDAIGMGLNMNVDHVAFASLKKYDGKETRILEPAELAQIAGRAGRHMNDGSFGTVAPLPPLPDSVTFAIESHRFPDVQHWVWRNRELDFRNLDSLIGSLRRPPRHSRLRLVQAAEDFEALCHLAKQDEIRRRATSPETVALLWEVCQIPDFGGHLVAHHTKLLGEIFEQLSGPSAALDSDWIEQSVQRVDDTRGDIDTLMLRIELIRTWNYISHHPRWVCGARDWQERTESVEERLSDALHARLVERFVQGSSAMTSRSGRRRRTARRPGTGNVASGSPFARLLQMELLDDSEDSATERQAEDWSRSLLDASHEQIQSDASGQLHFGEAVVGRLVRGTDLLHPEVRVAPDLELSAGMRSQLQRRLVAWSRDLVEETLAPLHQAAAQGLSAAGRGLVYQLEQSLGTVNTESARDQLRCLADQDRAHLRKLDVALGRRVVYVRSLLKPAMVRRRLALCAAHWGPTVAMPVLEESTVSLPVAADFGEAAYLLIGYPVLGPRAIRADLAERIHRHLRRVSARGRFALPVEMASWLGCSQEELVAIIEGYGYAAARDGTFARRGRGRQRRRRRSRAP